MTCVHRINAFFFFFNDTATTEIYTLSLHDALPISRSHPARRAGALDHGGARLHLRDGHDGPGLRPDPARRDRKSTRLNSSHANISYAVFCLKKKNNQSSITSYHYIILN